MFATARALAPPFMAFNSRIHYSLQSRLARHPQRGRKVRSYVLVGLCLMVLAWLLNNCLVLQRAATHPVDALFVLGGSIRREIYVAEQAQRHPTLPILISQGSKAPCVWLIFDRIQAPKERVWLEGCARSTFDNFVYGLPILQQWQVHKVKLVTSSTHLPRAKWLAQIILGAHGIWVDVDLAAEQGVPANKESRLKTGLDVTRSFVWAIVSQFYSPRCTQLVSLTQVNLAAWRSQGFRCEHQGGVKKL